MGKKDLTEKAYLSDNRKFADVVNYVLYNGVQKIHAEDLSGEDTTEVFEDIIKNIPISVQKYRDVLKKVVFRRVQEQYWIAIVGIENQTDINFAMPIRCLLYDAINYAEQVKETAKSNKEKDPNGKETDFLSGLKKDDTILPVITITVYWGPGKWDAPRSLHEMFPKGIDSEILAFVPDYKMNLIVPEEIDDLNVFLTDIKHVLKVVRIGNDKNRLKELLQTDEAFHSLDRDSAVAINTFTNLNMTIPESQEVIDVCKAVEEWRQEERAEGRAEGRTEGRAIGIKELRNLYNWLISTGRTADANQLMSSDDELFQNKLFLEYEKER